MFRVYFAILASAVYLTGCCDCDDVELIPPKTPSELTIIAPADGATVTGVVEVTVSIVRPRNIGTLILTAGTDMDSYTPPGPFEQPPDEHTFLWDSSAHSGPVKIQVSGFTRGQQIMDSITVRADQAPKVEFVSPEAGATVTGEVEISLAITDENGQRTVSFEGIDAERRGDLWFWDSTTSPDGPLSFKAVVIDVAGSRGEAQIELTVDNTGPSLEIVSPLPDATVGPRTDLEIRAEDTGVVGTIAVWANDEADPRVAFTAAPWSQVLDLSDLDPGPVSLRAQAQDVLGNSSQIDWIVNLIECDGDDDGVAARSLACGGDDCDDDDPGVPVLLPCTPEAEDCDDAAEPNDAAPGAQLATGTREYRACADDDYFHVEVAEGARSRIEVRFHASEGALDPGVQDLDGELLGTRWDLERGAAWSVDGPVTAILRVPSGSGQLYEVTTHTAPLPDCDDLWDPNDSREQASVLPLGTHDASLCRPDSDWYRVGLIEGQALAFDLDGNETDSLVVATVYDPDGEQIVTDLGSDASVSVVGGRTGFWLLHVSLTGPEEAYVYQLTTSEVAADTTCTDAGEPNDSAAQATAGDDIAGSVCGMDVDWFDLGELEAETPLEFTATDEQDVSYTVVGPSGIVAQTVALVPSPATFEVVTIDAGQHFLVVRPLRADATANYVVTQQR